MPDTPQFHRTRVFRDPVHGLIPINPRDSFLVDLIDTPEFQRLHRVRQLGVASLTFPGTDHSRLCHSLGVLHITTRILEILRTRYPDGTVANLIDAHHRTIKAAALLHDIGHGPFSHLMERAFDVGKDHEQRTKDMIVEEEGDIPDVLLKNGLNPAEVKNVIDHKFPFLFLQDIVSSQLDADRMDYLLRDSHFAGVNYGVIDLEWLLNCFCVGSYDAGSGSPNLWRLCLDEKRGLQAAEQLILARQHMSLQVYFHKSTRRWEAVFLCLIREAVRLVNSTGLPATTPIQVKTYLQQKGRVSHLEFLAMDEAQMTHAFSCWSKSTDSNHRWLAKLADGFLNRRKVLVRVDLPEDIPADKEAVLRKRLESEIELGTSHWELDVGEFVPYKGPNPEIKKLDEQGYNQSIRANSILLSNGSTDTNALPVAEESMVFRTLIDHRFRLRRLFCDPDAKNQIDQITLEVLNTTQLDFSL